MMEIYIEKQEKILRKLDVMLPCYELRKMIRVGRLLLRVENRKSLHGTSLLIDGI